MSDTSKLHTDLDLIGMRTQATAIGLVQLSIELKEAGVIDDAAISRVKRAIVEEIAMNRPRSVRKDAFLAESEARLDRIFAGLEPVGSSPIPGRQDDA